MCHKLSSANLPEPGLPIQSNIPPAVHNNGYRVAQTDQRRLTPCANCVFLIQTSPIHSKCRVLVWLFAVLETLRVVCIMLTESTQACPSPSRLPGTVARAHILSARGFRLQGSRVYSTATSFRHPRGSHHRSRFSPSRPRGAGIIARSKHPIQSFSPFRSPFHD